jgi:hypothetical protein
MFFSPSEIGDTIKCQLWDDLAMRYANEVHTPANYRTLNHSHTLSMQIEAAAKRATEEVQREEKKIQAEMRDKKVHVSKFRLLPPIKRKFRAHKIAA